METNIESTQPKKSLKPKKKSTVKKTAKRAQKASKSVSQAASQIDAGGYLADAKAYLASRTRGQKAAIAAGAVGFLTLLSNRKGRGLLKTLGGLALPIVAGLAQDKIVERATRAI